MYAKGMRLAALIYKPFTHLIPMRKKKAKKKTPKKSDLKKHTYITRPDGSMMKILVIKPEIPKTKVGILWIHGGGYVTGSPKMAKISMARHLAKEYLIVTPEYRLAVTDPYPAAFEDCYQTLCWMHDNAEKLGISRDDLIVGGDSAGGGLAIAVTLYARDMNKIKVKCQIPLYPMIDDIGHTDSMQGNKAPVWDELNTKKAWRIYLENLPQDNIPKYAAPARETNYQNLPPAITFVGTKEPFQDETINYVESLKKADVPVYFKLYPGCFHAFDVMVPWSKQAKDAKDFVLNSLHSLLEDSSNSKKG
ncbi:MAG: alpha/beta hydrolase [Bacilli bacterium]|nr:alpha/beta hydrolase [Bacilli bacterium]